MGEEEQAIRFRPPFEPHSFPRAEETGLGTQPPAIAIQIIPSAAFCPRSSSELRREKRRNPPGGHGTSSTGCYFLHTKPTEITPSRSDVQARMAMSLIPRILSEAGKMGAQWLENGATPGAIRPHKGRPGFWSAVSRNRFWGGFLNPTSFPWRIACFCVEVRPVREPVGESGIQLPHSKGRGSPQGSCRLR